MGVVQESLKMLIVRRFRYNALRLINHIFSFKSMKPYIALADKVKKRVHEKV